MRYDRKQHLEDLKALGTIDTTPYSHLYLNESEEGGGLVYRIMSTYILYEVPIYGGIPRFVAVYGDSEHDLNRLLDTVYSWT